MNAAGGLYPSLGRHFRSLTELAKAGCMSRQRARDCLDGKKNFTEEEKKAISANIALRITTAKGATRTDVADGILAIKAWGGNFDEIYRKKV